MKQSRSVSVGIALLAGLLCAYPVTATAQPDAPERCDIWASSTEAWPEIEQGLRENYAYLHRVDDVDALFATAAESAAKAKDLSELSLLVETLGYAFRDGHFHVSPAPEKERAWIPTSTDIWVERNDQGQYVLVDVKAGSDAIAKGLTPGMVVAKIGDQPLASAIAQLLAPVTLSPSPAQQQYAANVLLSGYLGESRSITIRESATERVAQLKDGGSSYDRTEASLSVTRRGRGRFAHFRFHNQLGDNDSIAAIDAAMYDHYDTDGIIIDLRDTPGGGNTTVIRAIIGHFIESATPYQHHVNAYENDILAVQRLQVEYVFPRAPIASVPLVVLAGRWTGSAGEALTMALDTAANAHTIGSDLADLLGTLNTYNLPSGCMELKFAFDRLYSTDNVAREDWTPDQLLSSAEARDNRSDPALNAAISHLEGLMRKR